MWLRRHLSEKLHCRCQGGASVAEVTAQAQSHTLCRAWLPHSPGEASRPVIARWWHTAAFLNGHTKRCRGSSALCIGSEKLLRILLQGFIVISGEVPWILHGACGIDMQTESVSWSGDGPCLFAGAWGHLQEFKPGRRTKLRILKPPET